MRQSAISARHLTEKRWEQLRRLPAYFDTHSRRYNSSFLYDPDAGGVCRVLPQLELRLDDDGEKEIPPPPSSIAFL
ncbi:hypothetical protein GW17_00030545 [Ensete ventricosum]|nr:hypothetical protein GW17_00030545 [Ensete ventricosum]